MSDKILQSFKPDWTAFWTVKEAEKELSIKFSGPGWYFSQKDTILAIPHIRPIAKTWHSKFKDDELFEFCVYNNRNPSDAFNSLANAPTRQDDRFD